MKTNYQQTIKRKEMVLQGAYDGRFRNKVVKDKKKHQSKTEARKFKNISLQYF